MTFDRLTPHVPTICGPLTDLNRDQACKRAARVFSYSSWAADFDRQIDRLPRLRNPRRVAALTAWIKEEGPRRLALITTPLPECTHPEAERYAEPVSMEDAMPACTC